MADDLTLTVGGRALSGWEEISVTLSCEAMPNSFAVRASQQPSGAPNPLVPAGSIVNEGDVCTVSLGADKVITGYVDGVVASYDANGHGVQISGRGKCQDLLEWAGFQIANTNALDVAQKLAKPYGITVKIVGDPGPQITQINLTLGETPHEVLEMVTRHAGFLYYEDSDGNLVLARAGSAKAGSGFAEGSNVQAAQWSRSANSLYSDYKASAQNVFPSDIFKDDSGIFLGRAKDPNVKRNRKLYIVDSAIGTDIQAYLQNRALWECARRSGRSRAVRVTVDSWRDGKGKLWAPNTLAQVSLPSAGLAPTELVIAEVTFRKAMGSGTTAEVALMPAAAFNPQPIVLNPGLPELAAEPAFKGTGAAP
jgi:prophage tail gpP-like protein